jgi:hypothetical protein
MGKDVLFQPLKLAMEKRSNRIPADSIHPCISQHSFTCLIIINDDFAPELALEMNKLTDIFSSFDSTVIGVIPRHQTLLDDMRKANSIKFRLISDEHNTIATRYGGYKKKEIIPRFMKRADDEPSTSIILLDGNEIVVCRTTEVSLDTIKVLSYYLRCITHDSAIRIKAMGPRNDIFDWILQNDIICKNFATELSDGLENQSFM